MPSYPRCRAGWTKFVLRGVIGHARAPAVRARLGEELLERIESKTSHTFLPFETHMTVLRSCRMALGGVAYRELLRAVVWQALQNPLLFAKQASFGLKIINRGMWSLLHATPAVWRGLCENAGEVLLEVSPDDQAASVTYAGLPAQFAQDDVWSLSWLGSLDAIVELALAPHHREADIVQTQHDREHGRYVWVARARRVSLPERH